MKKIRRVFRQGLTPKQMALSITLGSLIGVLPLFGISTAIIAGLAIYLRLNLPIAIFMTYAVSPIHILLFIPFIRIGEWVLSVKHSLLSFSAVKEAFLTDYVQAFQDLIFQIGCGLTGWFVVGIPSALFVFVVLVRIFDWIDARSKLT